MEKLERKLQDLIRTNKLSGLKIEFEAQGASLEEVLFLEKLANKYSLNLSVKISGPEAIRDLKDIKNLNIFSIIAPMIESAYALEKFVNSTRKVYKKNCPKAEINIESIVGFKNLDEIINSKEFSKIYGIKIGRNDLASSMGLNRHFVNSDEVFIISNEIASKIANKCSQITLGGGVCPKTFEFAKKIPNLTQIETRNVILKYSNDENLKTAINLALEFEISLIENKKNLGLNLDDEDFERIEILKKSLVTTF